MSCGSRSRIHSAIDARCSADQAIARAQQYAAERCTAAPVLRRDSYLAARPTIDSLSGQRAVVNTGRAAALSQVYVRQISSLLPPSQKALYIAPGCILQSEAVFRDDPGAEQEMCMGVLPILSVNRYIRNHPIGNKADHRVVTYEFDLVCQIEFDGQGDFDFARELRVLASLHRLHRIPQSLAVIHPFGRVGRRHNFGVLDAGFAPVVVDDPERFIVQRRGRAVRRRGDNTARTLAGNDFDAEMVNSHAVRLLQIVQRHTACGLTRKLR